VSNSHGNLLERMTVVILRTTNRWKISLAKVFQVNLLYQERQCLAYS